MSPELRPLRWAAFGLSALLLACASTAPAPVDSKPEEPAQAAPDQAAPDQAAATTSWIVQGTDLAAVKHAVEEVGGKITHELAIIRAVGAELTAAQLAALEKHAAVTRIYQDRQVGIDAAGPLA